MIFSKRIVSLVIKEFLSLFRDPKSRMALIGPPIIQMLIFSFAATLEVKNISLIVFNQDMGQYSQELVHRITSSKSFTRIFYAHDFNEVKTRIDEQDAIAAVCIQQDFSSRIAVGEGAEFQVIMDGRRSNASQIVNGYISEIANLYALELTNTKPGERVNVEIVERNWFNPNLLSLWSTVPSLLGILSLLVALLITSLSVARERELGTFDQVLVSPLLPYEILLGKTIPAVIVGFIEGLGIWLIGVTLFGVPFYGSFILLMFAILIFIISIVGVGLLISSISRTQQQAILGAFIFMVPAVTLSGYASPIENMPDWLQSLTFFNPLKHALIIIKGLFLKDMPFIEVWVNSWPLLLIGISTLTLAGYTFSRRLE